MVALEKKDSNLCNNLADMGLREVCAVFINKDISKCKDFPGEEEYCNQLITGNIPAGNGASFNRDGYYWMKSIELKDLTYCNNITDFGDRALCMAFVSKNISYCNQPQFEECYVNNKGS